MGRSLKPADLARAHGISTQAVRNYERDGFLPPAERTPSGYRVYTEAHAAALHAFLALVPALGRAAAGQVMTALHDGRLDDALATIGEGHDQLRRDRATLVAVRGAVEQLPDVTGGSWSVGELARQLRVTTATVRAWEAAGILRPARDPRTGHRTFDAGDRRDAELTHLLRRGGQPLGRIAAVVRQVREPGGAPDLHTWQARLTARGRAMLTAAARLDAYLRSGADEFGCAAGSPPHA